MQNAKSVKIQLYIFSINVLGYMFSNSGLLCSLPLHIAHEWTSVQVYRVYEMENCRKEYCVTTKM